MNVDVLVAGGGSAGLAAAVASARAGAKTLLIERHGSLGGMATASLVHSVCGLYRLRSEPGAVFAHRGFPVEFAHRLLASGGATGPIRLGRVDLILQHPSFFARVADEIAAAEPNLTVRFHTELIGVETADKNVRAVDLICRGHRERVEAAAFVDTTGDATLAWMAGAECEEAETLQRPAFIFSLGGVDSAALEDEGRLRLAQRIVASVRQGVIPAGLLGAHFRLTGRSGEAFVTIDLDNPPEGLAFDPHSPEALSFFEQYGRKLAHSLTRFLADGVPGFERAYLAGLPTRVGIRESRRVRGEIRIETENVLCGTMFPDAVAVSTWPIEMRERATGPRFRFPEGDRACEVPLRALRALGWGNLLMAGRCISSSHEAQASLRVIGTCLATGQAAGFAAAFQATGRDFSAAAICAAIEESEGRMP